MRTWIERRRACVAAGLLALLAGAGAAMAQDALSGRYRPADRLDDPSGELTVTAAADGWSAEFGGVPQQLLPLPGDAVAALYPDVPADAGLGCAGTAQLVLCTVRPGTRVALEGEAGFVSRTGYFAKLGDGSRFELVRLP